MAIFIFDLDGTLSLAHHRQHLVQRENPDWQAFFAACGDDPPNYPVINTLLALRDAGHAIYVFSGRSDEVRQITEDWFDRHQIFPDVFLMRPEGDFTPDNELKERWWYEKLTQDEKGRVMAVFDDRDKVVRMWRSHGIPCFQVAPGDF